MTYPLIGNYGRLVDDDQSAPAVAAGPRRRQRDRRGARRCAPARHAAARRTGSRRSRASTRGRSRATCATNGCLRGDRHRARRRSIATPPSTRARARAPLGGPGLRRPGLAGGGHDVGARRRRAARRDRRLRAEGEHRPRRCAGAARGSGSCRTRPRAREVARRATSTASMLSPGPGDPARLDGPVALARAIIDDGRPLLGICLGHQIVARAAGAETTRLRFGHHGANHPVRDLDIGLRPGDGPEPRGPGRRRHRSRRLGLPRQPGEPQRRLGRGPAPRDAADRDRPVPPRGRARARSTRSPCSTGSSPPPRGARRDAGRARRAPGQARVGPDPRVRARSSSARRPSSTTPGPRPAARSAPRASGRSSSTATRRRS